MRGPIRSIEIAGIALLLIVLAVVGSRVSAESADSERSGTSDIAALATHLRLAGLDVAVDGRAYDPQISTSGWTLMVDGEIVEVYAYDDAWSASADAARLSGSGGGTTVWLDTPHVFRQDRLLIIHPDGSTRLNELLSTLLDGSMNLHEVR